MLETSAMTIYVQATQIKFKKKVVLPCLKTRGIPKKQAIHRKS